MYRFIGNIMANDLRLVATNYMTWGLPGPGHVTCCRAVTSPLNSHYGRNYDSSFGIFVTIMIYLSYYMTHTVRNIP